MKNLRSMVICIAALLILASSTWAAEAPFYKGKTIRIVVGYSPGGGFDTFSRLVGRNFGAHLPGNPSVIVVNMPGAASMVAANRVYAMQPGDGLTIVVFSFGVIMEAVTRPEAVKFDARKFIWLGDPTLGAVPEVLWVRSDLPIKSFEDFKNRKTPLASGLTGRGSPATAANQFLASLGYPIKGVFGYRGTANVMAAMERGEVDARIMSQTNMQTVYRRYIDSGLVRPVLAMGEDPRVKPIPGVATFKDLNLDPKQQRMADFLVGTWKLLRLFAIPPGTPDDRVATLRKAFMETLNSPKLLEQAKRQKVIVSPASHETIEETIAGIYQAPPDLLARYKELLGRK